MTKDYRGLHVRPRFLQYVDVYSSGATVDCGSRPGVQPSSTSRRGSQEQRELTANIGSSGVFDEWPVVVPEKVKVKHIKQVSTQITLGPEERLLMTGD